MGDRSLFPEFAGVAKRDRSLGQWDTPPELAAAFVAWAGVDSSDRVLEPSAGVGNICRAARDVGASVLSFEIDAARAAVSGSEVRDFLEVPWCDFCDFWNGVFPVHGFSVVLMNPPYENDGETRHLVHALDFAPRVCGIVRLASLASESRSAAWRSMWLTRLAICVPRPAFGETGGKSEIAFVEVRKLGTEGGTEVTWCRWRELAARAVTR